MSTTSGTISATDPWLAHPVSIADVTSEIPGVATYHLQFNDPDTAESYRFLPGQFNMLYLPGAGEVAISVSADPRHTRPLAHTIRVAGNVTRSLSELGVGGQFALRGPFGSCWPLDECRGRDVVLVAGGIGLAPLRPAIYHLLDHRDDFGRVTLLYGSRTPDSLLYRDEYDEWKRRGMIVQTTVDQSDPGWLGQVGVVPLLLDRMRLPHPERTQVLACGPEVMMWYTIKSALERDIPAENVWLSLERNMNCAIGLCGHCQFGPQFICKDGPVLRYDRIASFLKVENF